MINGVSSAAKKILKDGELLKTTESLAFKLSNNYDFARRIAQEFSLIFAGQAIKFLKVDQLDRAYSHAGLYSSSGLGKDYGWKLVQTSGIFPIEMFRLRKLENITQAALVGTITEASLVPPVAITEDLVFVGEYATLMRGNVADSIAADMRAMLESGEYTRRLAKISQLREHLQTQPYSQKAKYIQDQLQKYEKMGMIIDLERSQIHVKTTTSWVISSARFGSRTLYGRSLLNMGDINRYRWRSYLPDHLERLRITSEVGSLPPLDVDTAKKNACREAWNLLVSSLKSFSASGLHIARDAQSYYERQKIWDETKKVLIDTYENEMTHVHFNQLVNLRTRAEFTRLLFQRACFEQFSRDQGYDFALPNRFIVDYCEDGEFAKQLWIGDYVPSMIDVINDVLKHFKRDKRSARGNLSRKGREIVVEMLKKGPKKREDLLPSTKKAGISNSLLDNAILPSLIRDKTITRNKFGWYSLVAAQGNNTQENGGEENQR